MDKTPSVLFSVIQDLTTLQKSIARENIGAVALFLFDPDTTTKDGLVSAIDSGSVIASTSGSNFVYWNATIHGGSPELHRVEDGNEYAWRLSGERWVQTITNLDPKPETGRLTVPGGGSATLTHGDWTFIFSVNSIQAGTVNVKNPNATSADIFSETRTYGNTVSLAGEDLSEGKDIIYCGNGDFKSTPTRAVIDIFDGTEWLELRIMQYVAGSDLVIDYRAW